MKISKLNTHITTLALSAAMCAALAACGGGSGGSSSPASSTSTGVAAIGSAIVGGSVSFTCASGATASATTDSNGAYSAALKAADYPCVVQVAGGQVNGTAVALALHSVAAAPGTTNVTPLTDLIVGVLGNGNASALDSAKSGDLSGVITANNLSSALAKVQTALATLPGKLTIAAGFNPLNSQFNVGDANDALLDQYAAALNAAGLTQADAVTQTASGQAMTQALATATAYTTPALTALPLSISSNLSGTTFGYVLTDPNLGVTYAATAAYADALGTTMTLKNPGPFSDITSLLNNHIGMLCSSQQGQSMGKYVFASPDQSLTEVTDPTELVGKTFTEYQDCAVRDTATYVADGSGGVTANYSNGESDTNVQNMLTSAGAVGDASVTHGKVYKYTANGVTTYVYLEVSTQNGSNAAIIDDNNNYVMIGVQQNQPS